MKTILLFQEKIDREIKKISSEAGTFPSALYDPLKYILSLGGKRMRPILVLIGCDLFDGDVEKAIPAAIGVELFHNFTLVHDDIMDNAPLRRNKKSVHEKWNKNVAILSGDVMLVKAYQQISKMENPILKSVLDIFNDTSIKVCEGQQLDMNYQHANKISIAQYLKMIELKTAVLLAGSLKIGAIIGGANEQAARHLYEFGKNIGIAFQLQDDLLDVYGGEKFGKQKGGDIIVNKKTYLLLKAMELASVNRYKEEELLQWVYAPNIDSKEKVEAITTIYDFLNVRKFAQEEMRKYFEKGIRFLDEIPVRDQKKKELKDFAENLLLRET